MVLIQFGGQLNAVSLVGVPQLGSSALNSLCGTQGVLCISLQQIAYWLSGKFGDVLYYHKKSFKSTVTEIKNSTNKTMEKRRMNH